MPSLRELLIKDPHKPIVAIITSGSLPVPPVLGGGIQTVVYDYALHNHEQNVIIFSALDGGLPRYELDMNGIGHVRIRNKSFDNFEITWNSKFLFRYSRYIHKACAVLKEIQPDVVHIHNMPHFVPIVRRALGRCTKIILTDHNTKIAEEPFVQRQLHRIMDTVDAVIYPSRKIAELDLLNDHPTYASKVSVIYNGVDISVYKKYPQQDIERIRHKYKITSPHTLLFVGRLVEEKGAHVLLEALPYVLKKIPGTSLIIVGSSFFGKGMLTPYVQKLQTLAKPVHDHVIFTGFIDSADLPILLSSATIFVSPVVWDDPSPKNIYEAAACEVPIISSARGGIPEIVIPDEDALLLKKGFSAQQLANVIIDLLQDKNKRETLTAHAKRRIYDKFTCAAIGAQWANTYKELIKK